MTTNEQTNLLARVLLHRIDSASVEPTRAGTRIVYSGYRDGDISLYRRGEGWIANDHGHHGAAAIEISHAEAAELASAFGFTKGGAA